MIEKLFFGIPLAVCVILFVRLLLGARRRQRFDDAVRRAWGACRRFVHWAVHWRSSRRAAAEAIRRARSEGEWDGNVYKPKSFRRPRKLH